MTWMRQDTIFEYINSKFKNVSLLSNNNNLKKINIKTYFYTVEREKLKVYFPNAIS